MEHVGIREEDIDEYVLQDYNRLMGGATYNTQEKLKELLPDEDEIKKMM